MRRLFLLPLLLLSFLSFAQADKNVDLNIIADQVSGTEGAYVFMDLYLDIQRECAAARSPKK